MRRAIVVLALCAVAAATTLPAAEQVFIAAPAPAGQTPGPLTAPFDGPKPEFEVASVRPNAAPTDRLSLSSPPGRFMMSGLPLQLVLSVAFRPQNNQIEGAPDWVRTERFDINAKMPDGAPQDQLPYMLQSLLEDRFQLKWHTETREIDIYALVIAREDGQTPKLVPSEIDCRPILEARQKALAEARDRGGSPEAIAQMLEKQRLEQGEAAPCSNLTSMRTPPGGGSPLMTITARGMELASLVSLLSSLSGRPVVDRTGLTGGFDFEFTASPGMALAASTGLAARLPSPGGGASVGPGASAGIGAPVPAAAFDDGPTVFQAVEEQLGLKLQAERGPGEFFIVDSIQRPDPD